MQNISIIIPTFERIESLKGIINSYLIQKYISEVIIVDDGGSEAAQRGIADLATRYPMIRAVSSARHRGLPAARNLGIRESKGEFVLFGEDDVILENNYTEQLSACLKRNKADVISGRLIPIGSVRDREAARRLMDSDPSEFVNEKLIFYRLWKKTSDDLSVCFTHSCSLIRREIFDHGIFFSEVYKGNAIREEVDFYIRARQRGFKIFFCPHTHIYHLSRYEGTSGGCSMNPLRSSYFYIKNNCIFYRRHYRYLKEVGFLKYNFMRLVLFVIVDRISFLLKCIIRRGHRVYHGIWLQGEVRT